MKLYRRSIGLNRKLSKRTAQSREKNISKIIDISRNMQREKKSTSAFNFEAT